MQNRRWHPRVVQSTRCPVRELAICELAYPRVVQFLYILLVALCLVVYCRVQEDFIAQSASSDGDVDRSERIRVYEELWKKCNDKIQVNFSFTS